MMRENKDILKERLSFLDEEVEENRSEINYLETLIEKLDKKAPKVLDYCKGEGFVETDKLGRIVVKACEFSYFLFFQIVVSRCFMGMV